MPLHAPHHQHLTPYHYRVCYALGLSGPIDLAGFSFGGRVALAAAATHPARVRRLVLTGVPADRDAQGRLILKSWRTSLERGNLPEFAWSSMLLCHGPAFLSKFESKIPDWVDFVVKNNRCVRGTDLGLIGMVGRKSTSMVVVEPPSISNTPGTQPFSHHTHAQQ